MAPAKVNLYLKVLGRRPDGYHQLDTLMARLELADELELSFTSGADSLEACGAALPLPLPPTFTEAHNLALRAVRSYRQKTGWPHLGVKLFIKKNIPLGAGLGGGSSNGATVLILLNQLAPQPLKKTELASLGLSLGADVPFFLQPLLQARAQGVGEILSPPPKAFKGKPEKRLGLVNSGIFLSTALVFKTLGLTNEPSNYTLDELPDLGKNDLLIPALKLEPGLAEVVAIIQASRPRFWGLSGSGATFWYSAPQSPPDFLPGWWQRDTNLS